jgi:microcystin degradation protein MlrC
MRIAIAGINTESSTFALHTTEANDFEVLRGTELINHYDLPARLGEVASGVDWVPILRAVAPPGGPTNPEVYDAFETETMERLAEALAEGPLDGVYLDIHGAMTVIGRESMEERYVGLIRDLVGKDAIISVSMDPHGNLSEELVRLIDLATSHRHAPHIDLLSTRDRAIRLLIQTIEKGARPFKVWVPIPMLLAGERTSTLGEPGHSICVDLVATCLDSFDVVDTSIWIGRAWADEARCSAAVMALGYDRAAAEACADRLAKAYWGARRDFRIIAEHSGTWDEALDFVLDGASTPVVLSDSGDNVTAGASGDITYAIRATQDRPDVAESGKTFLFAGLVDAPSLAAAVEAGVGSTLDRAIGATRDRRFGDAVAGPWSVEEIIADPIGKPVGARLRHGTISVIVQSGHAPFVREEDPAFAPGMLPDVAFSDAALDHDVVVVKNGYLFPSQTALASSAFLAVTPGGTDLDFDRLDYRTRRRPMFPLDQDFEPDLTPRVIPNWH